MGDDLIARLRDSQSHIMAEAADALEAQAKQIDELHRQAYMNGRLLGERSELRERISKLEAALKRLFISGLDLEKYEASFIKPDWWEAELEAARKALEKGDE